MLRTLAEVGVEVREDMSFEQLEQASTALAARKQTTGSNLVSTGCMSKPVRSKPCSKRARTSCLLASAGVSPARGRVRSSPSGCSSNPTSSGSVDKSPVASSSWSATCQADRPAQHARLPRVRRAAGARVHHPRRSRGPHSRAMGRHLGACSGEWLRGSAVTGVRPLLPRPLGAREISSRRNCCLSAFILMSAAAKLLRARQRIKKTRTIGGALPCCVA